MYWADLLRILVGNRFASKRGHPGSRVPHLPMMSSAVLTPWASMSFFGASWTADDVFPHPVAGGHFS